MTIIDLRFGRTFVTALLGAAICALTAAAADAACFASPAQVRLSLQRGTGASPSDRLRPARLSAAGTVRTIANEEQSAAVPSVVGLWNAEFFLGDGPDRYDQTFQQFHADGTELMLSNGLPPVLGNVCVGLWKRTGARTVKVKHMAWNWEPSGAFAGTFVMEVTLRVARDGRSYAGTWTADSFDPAGALIPSLHAEGVARARRIVLE
jgi:hypothetical protein